MAEFKPLIYSIIIIFLIGLLMNLLVPMLDIDIEEETEGTYIEPFVITGGMLISLISVPVTFISESIEGVWDFFSTSEQSFIQVNGTGEHEDYTLNGTYYSKGSNTFKKIGNTYDRLILDIDNGSITNATLKTSWFTFWWWTYDEIYKLDDIDGLTLNLFKINDDFDFENTATATFLIDEDEEEESISFTEGLEDFFYEVRIKVQDAIRPIGLLPSIIGLPLILILLLSIFYTIYTLIRGI